MKNKNGIDIGPKICSNLKNCKICDSNNYWWDCKKYKESMEDDDFLEIAKTN